MKLLSKIILLVGIIGLFSSCSFKADTFLTKFNTFIEEVDSKSADFDQPEWEKTEKKYTKFMDIYKRNESKFTLEQMFEVTKLAGKYRAIQIKWVVQNLKDNVNDAINKLYKKDE